MSAGLIIGVIYIVCAVLCFRQKKASIIWGVLLATFGIISIVGFFLKSDTLLFTGILLSCVFFLFGACIIQFLAHKKCRTPISATCISYNTYHVRRTTTYAPVFQYVYNDKEYTQQTPTGYSKRKFDRLYQIGQTYKILINENNPSQCTDNSKIPGNVYICLFLSIGMFVMYCFAIS